MPILRKENFEFGKWVDGQTKAIINLPKLIKTRMVIEANSGGGKSWLMRLLMELFFGYVQQIIIDPEGEFSSLRTDFGFILVTADRDENGDLVGDFEADPKTAEALARTTLKTHASIIIDISELSQDVRRTYVANFVRGLVDSPKEIWNPVLVWIDEGHDYGPEAGKGSAVSLPALKDLASKGRKRGQCLIIATQRLSKLSKDIVAECRNYMIGLTNYLDDQDTAGEILGFSKGQGKALEHQLRELEPGVFWASGSIFNAGLRQVKVGEVKTHHPEATEEIKYRPPPTPESVKPLLQEFQKIPTEAKRNLDERTGLLAKVKDQQGQIQSLTMTNRNLEARAANSTVSPEKLKEIQEEWFARGQKEMIQKFNDTFKEMQGSWGKARSALEAIGKAATTISTQTSQFLDTGFPKLPEQVPLPEIKTTAAWTPIARTNPSPLVRPPVKPAASPGLMDFDHREEGDPTFGRAERAILKFLALRPDKQFKRTQVGAMTQYSPNSGGFKNSLSKLNTAGLIQYGNGMVMLSSERVPQVIEILGAEYTAPEQNALEGWLEKLGLAAKKIYQVLLSEPSSEFTMEELAERTGYQVSGGFKNAVSNLITLGLAERVNKKIRLNQELLSI